MSNDWKSRLGMVYSTDPDYQYRTAEEEQAETLPARQQQLRVWLDRKQRAGKVVTLVKGFVGRDEDLAELARMRQVVLFTCHEEVVSELQAADAGATLIEL